jgi:acetolactate synthase-1/2/3 large subunit
MDVVDLVTLSGAAAVGRSLKECGIKYFFYVIGGMTRLFPAIADAGINAVLCRNEKTACNMADGYSRVTREPSVCYAQHGAAAAILASMLYEPMHGHSPVIALTGSTPTSQKDRWRYQECYEMSYFDATCKFNVDVTDLNRIAEYLRIAIQVAVSGCPGPTHVNMHTDMANLTSDMPDIYGNRQFHKVPPFRPRAEPEQVTLAAKLLASAERPVLVCGSGVHWSDAYDEVRQLSELLTVPVVTNYKGKGCFPERHPHFVGVMGVYGAEVANRVVRESDLVFFVATRADPHTTEEMTAPEPGKSVIIHLDIDPVVIGRTYKADCALVGDAKTTLQDLIATLRAMINKPKLRYQRIEKVAEAVRDWYRVVQPIVDSDSVPIKPQRMMKEISKILRPRDIVFSDTGHMICWTTRLLTLRGVGLTYVPCGGTLGSSFAMAMGGSFGAEKDQRVLNLIGDGGITYNLADLETMKRYHDSHVPFVVVVNNNSSLAQTRPLNEDWTQREAPWIGCSDLSELDYAKIAEAFGCYGVRVEKPSELSEAVERAFDSGKPAIVDVVSDKRQYPPIGPVRMQNVEPFPGIPVY